ncbi:hypothetical protein CSW53_27225 (plasmid) [Rhodococcus ruber]|nr:hypothetical protein CSW53_27225 [Rhodococcus ruber]
MRCVRAEPVAEVAQLALMGDVFIDPWLPDPVGSVIDPVVEFRVTSASPWVFSEKDPATEVHAGRWTTRLAHRWNDILVWRPDSTPESRRAGAGATVPQDVIDELYECTSLVSVSRLKTSAQQVSFDEHREKARTRPGVEADVVIRCVPEQISTLLWFQTLMRFSVWSGVATRTTSGLGQVEVRQVRRLSDLPRAVVPEWEVW